MGVRAGLFFGMVIGMLERILNVNQQAKGVVQLEYK